MFGSLRVLLSKGVRYSTVIDVGCADGHFFLNLSALGLVPGAVPLNIDANILYEDSLQAIRNVVGGHFRISAITDHEGESELTTSVHPYWASLRPKDDPYWQRVNNLSAAKKAVPATTLDTLRRQLALKPPFLLKLDVQGAEEEALRGATDVLKDTHVVICEADIDDFKEINDILGQNNFALYDVTGMERLSDGTLGWFYPVYINRALDFVRPKEFWDAKHNDSVVQVQVERRKRILKANAEMLARMQDRLPAPQSIAESRPPPRSVGRNDPCPCGSGKRYKHCCGAYRQST
jgi:FkbM family methyltransferase